ETKQGGWDRMVCGRGGSGHLARKPRSVKEVYTDSSKQLPRPGLQRKGSALSTFSLPSSSPYNLADLDSPSSAANSYYVAFPSIIIGLLNAKALADEHEHHLEHVKEEDGGELPERIVYPYFNKREKDLPWGPNTPFFNPKVNIPVE
ncbi:hypothetical protein JCM11641_005477, partial [Rhodosporidiobolus odoratus]